MDAAIWAVDGGRAQDQSLPRASGDGGFCVSACLFTRITGGDGGVFVDLFDCAVDTGGGEVDEAACFAECVENTGVGVIGERGDRVENEAVCRNPGEEL